MDMMGQQGLDIRESPDGSSDRMLRRGSPNRSWGPNVWQTVNEVSSWSGEVLLKKE